MRKFSLEKQSEVETCNTDHIKTCVYVLKEIKKRVKNMKETTFEVILD